jgi:hypothetical protein
MGKGIQEAICYLVNWLLHYKETTVFFRMLTQRYNKDDIWLQIPLWYTYIIWAMYVLGLSSSWGTSRICPAWSSSEHQLTPALSPIWGPRPKPRCPEEVFYSSNDSCSRFTQRLFPPKLPQQHTCIIPYYTFHLIHTYYTSHSNKQSHPFILHTIQSFISSALHSRPAALGLSCLIQSLPSMYNLVRQSL